MKRILLIAIAFVLFASIAHADNFPPRNIWITSIASSATANAFYQVTGSPQPATDYQGWRFDARAFQVCVYRSRTDLTMLDFFYAYQSNPASTGAKSYYLWKAEWGPMQTLMNPPAGGLFIATTPTAAGTAGDAIAQLEAK